MLFNSPVFFIFFFIYFLFHASLKSQHQLLLIIIGSTIFYTYWYPFYIWVPFILILMAFFGGIWIHTEEKKRIRKYKLIIVLMFLVSPLLFYKYANFFYKDVFGLFFDFNSSLFNYPLPLGISFITFTMMAYVIDVYWRNFSVVNNLSLFSSYTLFFPQLIAGPILRPKELIPQLEKNRTKKSQNKLILGTAIFTLGLLKKMVIADPLAEIIDSIFSNVNNLNGWNYLLAIYGFSVQIYCDFSGYTDMAIGSSIILGIKLPENFKQPYLAVSVKDFWRRWHITLSNWLRDYIYIPLGGNKKGFTSQAVNVFITMFIGGLWHGANWTFIIWGLIHATGIVISNIIVKLPKWIAVIITFHFIAFAWIFFRVENLHTAKLFFTGLFTERYTDGFHFFMQNTYSIICIILFFCLHRFDNQKLLIDAVQKYNKLIVWNVIILIWILSIVLNSGSSAKFIYFDF